MLWPQTQSLSIISLLPSVRQEGFLSSFLSIRFFSKALVGEHRALSFSYGMAMILTPLYSPDVSFAPSFHSRPRIFFIYTNIFKHAPLHESRCPCSRHMYCFPCFVCPNFVR